jgi:hypothetical protein
LVAAKGEFVFAPVNRGEKSTPPAARTYDDWAGEAQTSESSCNRLTRMICLHEGSVIMERFEPLFRGPEVPQSTCPEHGTKHPRGVYQASNDPLPQTGTEPPIRRPCHVPALRPLRRPVGEDASGTSQTHISAGGSLSPSSGSRQPRDPNHPSHPCGQVSRPVHQA